mmetsp:Transcript_33655/g.49078  ORF Transcript_33655/g.49078 Transcript_33655/m.49078 type:complete len:254 (-) Transcript_33655:20-781(-)
MPLIVERMVHGSESASADTDATSGNGDDNIDKEETSATRIANARASSLLRARTATAVGAVIPIILSLIWAAISTTLVEPTISNPVQYLLSMGPKISIPVGLLATGAIGTTLLGSFLAMGHFVEDIVCSKFGHCSLSWVNAANLITVAVPSILACLGPSLYLPLLAFSGAYPTAILHGLSPALAVLVLRRRIKKQLAEKGITKKDKPVMESMTPRIVPGGNSTVIILAVLSIGLVASSTCLALSQMARRFIAGV